MQLKKPVLRCFLFVAALVMTTAQAGKPLWTIVPAPGSNPTQIVAENGTSTVLYVVENQSSRARKLVMQSIPGITQTALCELAPKGSCTLTLTISGNGLSGSGIHGGPVLCLATPEGAPNSNQCYQPGSANSLNITRGPPITNIISVSPTSLNFGAGSSDFVTVTNSPTSSEPAYNVAATIPGGSNLSVQSTTCGASLAIGASCTITFTSAVAVPLTNVSISGTNTNSADVAVTVISPLLTVNPSTLLFAENSTGTVTVTNDPSSLVSATNVVATIPGGSNLSVQSTTCGASLAVGASCTITFTSAVVEALTNVSISGSNTSAVNVAVTVASAILSLNPSTLMFAEFSTGTVTVTNDPSSLVSATNVVATIPGGSNLSVQSTTCGASLAIGASCTITFASSVLEGPTTVPIAGSDTNIVNVSVTVTSQPQISITNPVQQSRIVAVTSATPLSLEITNNVASVINADSITVTNKASCPNLLVDNSNCTSLAPGASCNLLLTSNSPYAPCTITVGGSNTSNSPTALIAFSYLGGLVYSESGGSGSIIIDVAQAFGGWWTNSWTLLGAVSTTNGVSNTNTIVAAGQCTGSSSNCAAYQCRQIAPAGAWYLPAINELSTMRNVFCANNAIPCNFGGFSNSYHWSSTEQTGQQARALTFPSGGVSNFNKDSGYTIRCARSF